MSEIKNEGVKMLLSRMDSNPDEFSSWHSDKWQVVLDAIRTRVEGCRPSHISATNMYPYQTTNNVISTDRPLPFLSDYEVQVLYDKWAKLQGDAFTATIMQKLLEGDDKAESTYRLFRNMSAIGVANGGTGATASDRIAKYVGKLLADGTTT